MQESPWKRCCIATGSGSSGGWGVGCRVEWKRRNAAPADGNSADDQGDPSSPSPLGEGLGWGGAAKVAP